MTIDILMPKMGESITESRVLRWLKQPGDRVDKDESLLEIATDKVDTDVPSPARGILVRILVQENETVDVGTTIGVIETDEAHAAVEAAPAPASSLEQRARSNGGDTTAAAAAAPMPSAFSTGTEGAKKFCSPVVQRLAAEYGVGMRELTALNGTGAGGRITKKTCSGTWNPVRRRTPRRSRPPQRAPSPRPPSSPAATA